MNLSQQQIDFDAIRRDHSLLAEMTKALGEPVSNNTWRCPFHNEKHAPGRDLKWFVGQDGFEHFKCFAAKTSCVNGDVIDFVQQQYRLNRKEAIERLTGQPPTKQVLTPQQTETPKAFNNLIPKAKAYHTNMNGEVKWWRGQGLVQPTIDYFQLGYCPDFYISTDPPSRVPTYTIPYFYRDDLVSLKHRLESPNGSGKYRYEKKGMRVRLFHPQGLYDCGDTLGFSLSKEGEALLLEGETKTMFFWQLGYRCAGIPGSDSWQDRWSRFFKHLKRVYIAVDMDVAQDKLLQIAGSLKRINVEVARLVLPVQKPDDFFVRFGGTIDDLGYCLDYALKM